MDVETFPTKSNLLNARTSLKLSIQGYELLDKKRNILITEMMSMIKKAEEIQSSIEGTFSEAYHALQAANISLGIATVQQIGYAIPEENSLQLRFRSIMGVEIPLLSRSHDDSIKVNYSLFRTNYSLDEAYAHFNRVKELIFDMAEIENTIYRLANHIKKTQKRANALKSVIIPKYQELVSTIQNALEEKDREEFSRLHVIKEKKGI